MKHGNFPILRHPDATSYATNNANNQDVAAPKQKQTAIACHCHEKSRHLFIRNELMFRKMATWRVSPEFMTNSWFGLVAWKPQRPPVNMKRDEKSDCKWLCPTNGMLQWQFQETKAVNIYKPLYLFYFIVLLSHLTVQTPRAPRALRFQWAHQWPPSARCQGTCLPRKRMKSQHHMVTAMVAG